MRKFTKEYVKELHEGLDWNIGVVVPEALWKEFVDTKHNQGRPDG